MFKDNKKRVVIIGSAGVGKTTLFNRLSKRVSLKLIPEQARIICKKFGFKNIYEIKNPTKFRWEVLNQHRHLENKYTNFLADRSTIDCWVHHMRWDWNNNKTFEAEKYFKKAKSQALKYSHIIYIPRLIEPEEDGFRWNDDDYQNQIDRMLLNTLREWGLIHRTYFIKSTDIKQRVKESLEFLN